MSHLTEALRTIGVCSDEEFFTTAGPDGQVWLSYDEAFSGGYFPCWTVYHTNDLAMPPDERQGPMATFGPDSLEYAKEWASKYYSITQWARTPFGGYGDATFVNARTAELKLTAAARQKQNDDTTAGS